VASTPAAAPAHTQAHKQAQEQANKPEITAQEADAPPPRPAARAPAPLAGARCENCATPVTGPYCAQCGQKHGHALHSVWHFLREATEDLTHADSRLWQTLIALLARPGALTREFLDGHRVRYLPPLRLYLVISLLYFLMPQLPALEVQISSSDTAHGFRISTSHAGTTPITPERATEICQMMLVGPDKLLSLLGQSHREPLLSNACQKSLKEGATSYQEVFRHNTERAMFVFLPLLAFFAWLLYWRPRHYYVEHLLFFVHNHSFLFLVLALSRFVAMLAPQSPLLKQPAEVLDSLVFVYICGYLYFAMRSMYGQGRLLTLAKYGALLFFYFLTAVLGMLGTAAYTALTL
jgi:hypothetical protein